MNQYILQIYKIFFKKYGSQGWWPVYSLRSTQGRDDRGYFVSGVSSGTGRNLSLREKFEIAIGAVLTQNTAWTNVEKAINNLVEKNLMDPQKILDIDHGKLAEVIRSSGYYNQKAKKIKILTRFLLKGNYLTEGNIPNREDLLDLWGIGEETADSILLYAYGVPVFVVDAYTKRIFKRLGLLEGSEQYGEITGYFTDSMESDYTIYQEYHALIVKHAKESCQTNPKCDGCSLNEICSKLIY